MDFWQMLGEFLKIWIMVTAGTLLIGTVGYLCFLLVMPHPAIGMFLVLAAVFVLLFQIG